jgi:pimeloyl-ACP methyl ester carboxylesterase
MKVKKKLFKVLKYVCIVLLLIIVIALLFPTWTPKIAGSNSISELKQVNINGTKLELMIRGQDKDNPIILFVHGGPGCSEIPYVTKYQDLLEKSFTVVHYDQRASGKSYHFFEDYSKLSSKEHVEDLLAVTDYVLKRFDREKVILIGHSYGTYIATQAAYKAPGKYTAYVGIGQMSDLQESELDSLEYCIQEAKKQNDETDYDYLQSIYEKVKSGDMLTPRTLVRKYGGAARLIDDNEDYLKGFLYGSEYNLMDVIRFNLGVSSGQDILIEEALREPLSKIVTSLDLPYYFVMGQYDYMTSTSSAKNYFNKLKTTQTKDFVIFENSAHYPQFEEKEKFYEWMCDTFIR